MYIFLFLLVLSSRSSVDTSPPHQYLPPSHPLLGPPGPPCPVWQVPRVESVWGSCRGCRHPCWPCLAACTAAAAVGLAVSSPAAAASTFAGSGAWHGGRRLVEQHQGSLEFCIFKRSFWKMQREGVEELLSLFLSCSACKRTGTSCLKLSLMIFAHRGELYSFVHLINPFYSCHSSRHTAPWAWPMPRMTMYCRVNNNWLISLKTRLWAF